MIVLLHGIHTEGDESVAAALRPYLTERSVYPDYGWIAALETRRINPAVIGTLLPYIRPDDVLIGHSNGGCLAYRISCLTAIKGLVLINAALRTDIVLAPAVQFCHVYSNKGDDITQLAEFEARLPISPVDPLWGKMGDSGYTGSDPRIRNFYCDDTHGMPKVSGHGAIARPENMKDWGPFIDDELKPYR